MVSKENKGPLLYLKLIAQSKWDGNINTPSQAEGWATHEAQLQTISTLQQFTKMHYFLVQTSPNNLLTYFTMF